MKLFVFPLGHVLLYPGTSKPLHIFEPRYLQMLKDAIEEKVPIAIGFVDDINSFQPGKNGQVVNGIREVVGYGHPHILEVRPDGTFFILLPGQGKAKLQKVLDDSRPYLVCEAEILPEDSVITEQQSHSFIILQKLLLSWLQNNIHDDRARDEFRRHLRTPEQIIGCVANYLVVDPDLQQWILELDRLDEKVRVLSGIVGQGQAA